LNRCRVPGTGTNLESAPLKTKSQSFLSGLGTQTPEILNIRTLKAQYPLVVPGIRLTGVYAMLPVYFDESITPKSTLPPPPF
jgi:hypothetical protein